MEITLKVTKLLDAQSGVSKSSGKQWLKQEFIGETDDQYPKSVCVTVFNPTDNLQVPLVGDNVKVSFDIESRSWTGRDGVERWSTEIKAWKIEQVSKEPVKSGPDATFTRVTPPEPQPAYDPQQYQVPQVQQAPPPPPANSDDLPF
jgi:hypothetical protein